MISRQLRWNTQRRTGWNVERRDVGEKYPY